MSAALLVLNTGSSSVKFRLFALDEALTLLAGGKVEDIGTGASFKAGLAGAAPQAVALEGADNHDSAMEAVLNWLDAQPQDWQLLAAAHRIVHGGERFTAPVALDQEAMDYLQSLSSLAPLHQPHNLAGVRALARRRPGIRQYGCFDTAFHARHGALFNRYALPDSLFERGIRRYGFHGLSYDWIAHQLRHHHPKLAQGKVVAAHLGNGASLCAMKQLASIDTTMGMTALEGLPMGTRCGNIDAGAVVYMVKGLGMPIEDIEYQLYEESGLKGLSGLSNDVKTLLASSDPKARFALNFFALKVAQQIAAMAVSLGGLDAVVFTGGIGENAAPLRKQILAHLAFLPPFGHLVIAANEEGCMALEIQEHFAKELL
ncbi:MAG: acetate/propionate family kinase [Pseudomonadota bacterium]|uniref:acetate/propionate family kinase n=1 Tax=Gallaecimonas pentaromativorans TaxID=584787 RepID=UPI00067F0B00|nr:acetate/propionate family kinase [Gallaecimonas pentaromativorans]MED5525151.1 acetate/propionate family kinase [Pseudomonadota bacterium]